MVFTSSLEYLITAQNQAGKVFDQLRQQMQGLGSGMGSVLDGAKKATAGMTDIASAVGIVGQVFDAAAQGYEAIVGSYMDYAMQVKDLGRTIGASAEEASMLIQAADDMEISYGALTAGLEAAIRKGVDPSIEGIAELADQYNAIQDPISRSRFLMDTFGRSGADLAQLMSQGSAGIREMGAEAKALGLTLDDNAIQKAEEYRMKLDNLGDKIQAIGMKAAPILIDGLSSAADAVLITTDSVGRLNGALDEHNVSMINSAQTYQEYIAEMDRAKQVAISGAAATNLWLGPVGAMAAALQVNAHEIDIASRAEFEHQRQLAATEQAYLKSAAAALAYSQVVASGATQGVGGYMGWDPNRGRNPSRDNPVYEFLTPGRASGGPVWAGITRMVGENGPEPFTPEKSGQIASGAVTGGSTTVQLTVQLNSMFGIRDQAEAERILYPVVENINRRLQRNGSLQ